jgi:hypothetical protein
VISHANINTRLAQLTSDAPMRLSGGRATSESVGSPAPKGGERKRKKERPTPEGGVRGFGVTAMHHEAQR